MLKTSTLCKKIFICKYIWVKKIQMCLLHLLHLHKSYLKKDQLRYMLWYYQTVFLSSRCSNHYYKLFLMLKSRSQLRVRNDGMFVVAKNSHDSILSLHQNLAVQIYFETLDNILATEIYKCTVFRASWH